MKRHIKILMIIYFVKFSFASVCDTTKWKRKRCYHYCCEAVTLVKI